MDDRLEVTELRQRVEQLQRALESRVVVEQAKGVLAERYRLPIDDAFALMRFGARSSSVRLHELAAEVVQRRDSPAAIRIALAREARASKP
jgi:AmiR/NasT family two-component response regulator